MNIQVEASFGSSSGRTSVPPSSPNTSLQVTPSRGSDQKPETSGQASGSFFQNPDNVRVTGGQFNSNSGHHVTINLTRKQVTSGPRRALIYLDPGSEGSSVERASRVCGRPR